jgi:ubiquinone/menaquinone biosynthesis C-methylase UbiE
MALDAAGSRRFYDRFGRLQDAQRFYEDSAVHRLVQLADFDQSESVFELGCGTGRLAANLLTSTLPPTAKYLGVDVSSTMVGLATARLARWSERASVQLVEPPAVTLPGDDGAFDHFLATYIFDLLSPDDARTLIAEAGRLLSRGGLLAVVSLTRGTTQASRIVASGWNAIATRWPALVGGCRPIELRDLIIGREWHLQHAEVVVRYGVPSEVVVARRAEATES